ncbi:hypothetical protein [Cohnella soli]|uniref:Uncharacterized protein n=1 Tax=Cohnella soli TaxID=425005 RepID=A0ABW0HLQ1_9BACL
MEIVIKSANARNPIWNHFLLQDTQVTWNKFYAASGTVVTEPLSKVGGAFRRELADSCEEIELVIRSVFRHKGIDYQLLNISQRFMVNKKDNQVIGLTPTRWQKVSLNQRTTISKITPSLHPHLQVNGETITVSVDFVDITQLFRDIHGDTPWFSILNLLQGVPRHIRVMASLQGDPFIWFIVIPGSVAASPEIQPHVLFYPADYGGIHYESNSMDGIKNPNHSTSVGNIQCSGETLFMFLTKPITDSDYDKHLEKYLELQERYRNRTGNKLPPLHHFRDVLGYNPEKGVLDPRFWEVPFGFEQALHEKKQILFIPQMNGGNGGIAIRDNLMKLIENAVLYIYTHSHLLNYETIRTHKLILTGYSQSGGNVFTATKRNLTDVKAILCFELQYMNKHLKGVDRFGRAFSEDASLVLGKDVIPDLLKQGGKVAIIGRRKNGWQSKYLPDKVPASELILLPDDSHYPMLDYPDPSKPYDPNKFPVLARRYSRLLHGDKDAVIDRILSQDNGVVDQRSIEREAKVEEIIYKLRKSGFDDEKMIKTVFTPAFNVDDSGGYYTHNFIVSCGQELAPDGQSIYKFFHHALNLIT